MRTWISAQLAVVAALVVACGGAASAHAHRERIVGFIGGPSDVGSGGLFTEPSDVAIYAGESDDPDDDKIFVSEALNFENNRVQRLDRHGNFELMWGKDVVRAGASGDKGEGYEVCTAATSCQHAPFGSSGGEFMQPTGLAVSRATAHVYVMDLFNNRVQEFDLDGKFVRAWGWGVDSGADAFEVCTSDCHRGITGGTKGEGNPGQFATARNGSLAVRPGGSEDVFVTDGGNNRVLEFEPDGGFARAWGWGVATGSDTFEVCTAKSGCRRGRPSGKGGFQDSWPYHLTVDEDGVVYASGAESTRIVRFDADPPPDPPSADAALLDDIGPDLLTGHTTMGIATAPLDGDLLVARDKNGPMVFDELHAPGALMDSSPSTSSEVIRADAYVPSINGLEVSPSDGGIYLPTGTALRDNEPSTAFTGCRTGLEERPCHGLAVFGRAGPLLVAAATPVDVTVSTATLTGVVTPHGVARYRFQVSTDGVAWRGVGVSRYASGTAVVPVAMGIDALAAGTLYRFRIVAVRKLHGTSADPKAFGEGFLMTAR